MKNILQKIMLFKFPFQKKIAIVFAVTIAVLAFIFCVIGINNRYSHNTAQSVIHAQQVLLHTEELRTEVDEIESGVRGYIITGDEKYLQLYVNSSSGIKDSIMQLKPLISGNRLQRIAIDSLSRHINKMIESVEQLVNVRRTLGFEASTQFLTASDEGNLADNARKIIIGIQQEETRLLTKSKADNIRSIRNSSTITLIFVSICVLLLVIAFIVITRNTRLRNEAEEKIKTINSSLTQAVREITREIIEKEQQYRFLIENMRERIQVIGFDWKYLFLNNAAVQQSNYCSAELIGYKMMEKYAGIENTALFKVLQHCMQERVPETFENEFIYPDGTKSWFELSIQPIPEGLFILSINITARKKVEIELADQQLKQQKLIIETTIHAQEKERNELGRELHDNINQILATVKLYLNVAKSDVNNREELLEKSHQFVSTAIEETRKLSHILVAPSLGNITLHDVLEKLAHEENLCNGLRVEFINKTGKKISFDKSKELMLYRIAQEQINNIRKHAQAKKVLINLNASAQNIIFSITDNGIGFDPGKKAHGIGLKNITSRVQYYSGKTNLISSPGKGCTLEVIVPL